jgi:hypothetical protein
MTVVNNSAPRTHPNEKLRYISKSGMSRDHTRTGSRLSRCLEGVAEVRPCETGCKKDCDPSFLFYIFVLLYVLHVISASYPGAMCCSMACVAFAWQNPFRFLERIAISGADSINWIFRGLKYHFSLKTV